MVRAILKQGTNVGYNVMGGLLINFTSVAIALLSYKTNLNQIHQLLTEIFLQNMNIYDSLKLTDFTQWNVGAVVLVQFMLFTPVRVLTANFFKLF